MDGLRTQELMKNVLSGIIEEKEGRRSQRRNKNADDLMDLAGGLWNLNQPCDLCVALE